MAPMAVARLAQEAEGSGERLNKQMKSNADTGARPAMLAEVGQSTRLAAALRTYSLLMCFFGNGNELLGA